MISESRITAVVGIKTGRISKYFYQFVSMTNNLHNFALQHTKIQLTEKLLNTHRIYYRVNELFD